MGGEEVTPLVLEDAAVEYFEKNREEKRGELRRMERNNYCLISAMGENFSTTGKCAIISSEQVGGKMQFFSGVGVAISSACGTSHLLKISVEMMEIKCRYM